MNLKKYSKSILLKTSDKQFARDVLVLYFNAINKSGELSGAILGSVLTTEEKEKFEEVYKTCLFSYTEDDLQAATSYLANRIEPSVFLSSVGLNMGKKNLSNTEDIADITAAKILRYHAK
jgi:hypothetical protein